jgi:glycosyltransferase involved in cell wall biosynthesis
MHASSAGWRGPTEGADVSRGRGLVGQARRALGRLLRVLGRLLRVLGRRWSALRRLVTGSRRTSGDAPTARPTVEVRPRRLAVRVTRPRELRISAVLDTFSAASFGPDADLDTSFGPDDWEPALESHAPHLLLVESAWQGNGGTWQYQVGSYSYATSVGLPHLTALVDRCRRLGIPTVFWNKEDPVHFDKFKEAATLFDVVLTTDADRIPAYEALPGARADTVEALPFAAQPALHHPVGAPDPREPYPVFAGTFYRNRHADRRVQLEMLLDAARPFGLRIFDRMGGEKTETAGFPDRFDEHVQGGLPYEEMVEAYRRYRVFLNTNSVTASPTMFSRRVFELLASGTPVVSTPSVGMEAMLGSVVRTVRTRDEATAALTELLTDDHAWRATSLAGLELVHGQHTTAHRLASLARTVGIEVDPDADHAVTVLVTDRAVTLDRIASRFGAPVAYLDAGERPPTGTPWVLLIDGSDRSQERAQELLPARRYATAEAIGLPLDGAVGRDRYADELADAPVLLRPQLVRTWIDADDPAERGRALRDVGARQFVASAGADA